MPKHNDNKPKGRTTAYAYFIKTCHEQHKRNHPEEKVQFGEFGKRCAQSWKMTSEQDKQYFKDMSERDKQRHDAEMESYVPPKGERMRGKKGHKKDPNAPKRSLSAFFWYCSEGRQRIKAQNPEYRVGDIAKVLGRLWAEADALTKQKYEAMAERDKARYAQEMAQYKNGG